MNRPFYPAVSLSLTHLVYCFYSFQPSLGHKNDRQRQKNSGVKKLETLICLFSFPLLSPWRLTSSGGRNIEYEVRELGNGFLLFYGFSLTSDDSSSSCLHIRRNDCPGRCCCEMLTEEPEAPAGYSLHLRKQGSLQSVQ